MSSCQKCTEKFMQMVDDAIRSCERNLKHMPLNNILNVTDIVPSLGYITIRNSADPSQPIRCEQTGSDAIEEVKKHYMNKFGLSRQDFSISTETKYHESINFQIDEWSIIDLAIDLSSMRQ